MSLKKKIRNVIGLVRAKKVVPIPAVVRSEELLKGKTVFITGGSGGIGMAIAKKMLSVGANVIISGTNENKLINCVNKLKDYEENVRYLVLDLNDVSTFDVKIEEACMLFDEPISILVNSAGVVGTHSFLETTEEEYDRVFDINVKGIFFVCQSFAKYFIENHIDGRILNLSSSSALRPAWGPYQMSKWSIRGFTIGLADLLLPHNIIVNAIAPGPTATNMLKKDNTDDLSLPSSPIKRFTTPEEIAELALILVSDIGKVVVGDTLYATGGSGVISLHR